MAVFEIPLSSEPQRFSIVLGAVSYRMKLAWNIVAACWVLDIADDSNEPLLLGLPLVTGADLLAQHRHIGIAGSLIVQTDHDALAVPTFENLGTTGHLFFVTED